MANIVADPRYKDSAVSREAWSDMLLSHLDDDIPISDHAVRVWFHLSAVAEGKPQKPSIGGYCFRIDFPNATIQELDALADDAIAELTESGLLKAA